VDKSWPAQAELGVRLRVRRRERGLSLRQLTRLVGLTAHSNLADYEAGRRLPPQDVVAACEKALGISDGELTALRLAALTERSLPEVDSPTPTSPRRNRRRVLSFICLGLVTLVGAGLIGWLVAPRDDSSARLVEGVSNCDRGAVVLESTALVAARGTRGSQAAAAQIGTVALRFSASCALGWARFIPTSTGSTSGAGLVLSVHRVSDGAFTEIRLSQVVGVESDPLLTVPGCIYAQAQVRLESGQLVTAQTGCFQG